MSLLENIKSAQLAARKAEKPTVANLLTTLIGECERVGKDLDDKEVLAVITKMLKNAKETLRALKARAGNGEIGNTIKTMVTESEIELLEAYLPKQLTEEEIRQKVAALKATGQDTIKEIMQYFKTMFSGQYDAKLLSQIAQA